VKVVAQLRADFRTVAPGSNGRFDARRLFWGAFFLLQEGFRCESKLSPI
jgi:hypothetical protein